MLTTLNTNQLRSELIKLRGKEREAIAELILYLAEVDSRRVYREFGFASLFSYCNGKLEAGGLGYSAGGAQRRVLAARAVRMNPEVYTKLREGWLTLSAVVELAQVMTEDNSAALIEASQGRTKLEVQKLVATLLPPQPARRERIVVRRVVEKPTDENDSEMFNKPPVSAEPRFTFTFDADEEFLKLFEEAKLCSGVREMKEVMRKALKSYVDRCSPSKREERRAKRSGTPQRSKKPLSKKQVLTRAVPTVVRDRVRLRDGNQCTFVAQDGTRCRERCGLEVDHIRPIGFGGGSDERNLRLLCRQHNLLAAERVYGKVRMEKYRRATRISHEPAS